MDDARPPEPSTAPGAAPASAEELRKVAKAEARSLKVDGNALTLITDGPERLTALLALIDGARKTLRLLYYIYAGDESGAAVRDALIRALGRGVAVSLLVDDFGSSDNPDGFFDSLRAAGAHVCRFHPSIGRRYLLRNHQKLLLADEARVLIGGFNVADDYFRPADEGGWRDIGLVVEGPAAVRLAPYYDALLEWARVRGARIRELRAIIHRYSENKGALQWQFGGPMRRLSPWATATCRDLSQSRDVEMIAAYFAPPGGMLKRIARIGNIGRARVITAAKSDNHATIAAARFTYGRLLKRGVELYEYQRTKLHSKLLVLDDVVHIGSSNFDIRSLYLNMEMMLRVDDPDFAGLMRVYFEGELEDSLRITPALHRKRGGLGHRLNWAVSFFLVTTADYTVTRRLNFGGGG